jgi:hypothetical protein
MFGTWLLFFHILGIMILTDKCFSKGLKPPTRFGVTPTSIILGKGDDQETDCEEFVEVMMS